MRKVRVLLLYSLKEYSGIYIRSVFTVHVNINSMPLHSDLQPPSLIAPSQPISIPSAQCTHSLAQQRADDYSFHSINVRSLDDQQDVDEDGHFENIDNADNRNEYTRPLPFSIRHGCMKQIRCRRFPAIMYYIIHLVQSRKL